MSQRMTAREVVGVDVPHAAGKPERDVRRQRGSECVGVVDGEQVRIRPSRTALARVSEILETVETLSMVVLVKIFTLTGSSR